MFIPIPFHSYFLKKFSEDESLGGDLDVFNDFYSAKRQLEADLSSTHDETEVSSLVWEEESRREPSSQQEAEVYTNYLDSESLADPIPLLPFLSIRLRDCDQYSSAATTKTIDEEDEKHCSVSTINGYEIWWGVEEATSPFCNPPRAPTIDILSMTGFSSDNSSTEKGENITQGEKSTLQSEESSVHQPPAIPKFIEYMPDQPSAAVHRDSWLFDPVETLVFGKPPLACNDDDSQRLACFKLQEFFASHVNFRRSEATCASICETLHQYPQIAQVRYHVSLVDQQEDGENSQSYSKGKKDFNVPCYPLSIFSATGHLQGVKSFYEAYPEAIGFIDKGLGTALHYACYCSGSVSVVQFLLDRFPDAARITNRQYQSPLHMACSASSSSSVQNRIGSSQLQIVELLLECFPAAVRLLDENGCTPFHMACQAGAPVEVLAALVRSSAEVIQMATRTLEKPLHVAAACNKCITTIQYLLNLDPSQAAAIDDKMQTPLHKACTAQPISPKIVRTLVNAYPNALTMRDDNIETPYDIALRLGHASPDLLRVLSTE
jgi:ankyrin repeat protein